MAFSQEGYDSLSSENFFEDNTDWNSAFNPIKTYINSDTSPISTNPPQLSSLGEQQNLNSSIDVSSMESVERDTVAMIDRGLQEYCTLYELDAAAPTHPQPASDASNPSAQLLQQSATVTPDSLSTRASNPSSRTTPVAMDIEPGNEGAQNVTPDKTGSPELPNSNTSQDSFQEHPPKRRKIIRKKQILPAEISYVDLAQRGHQFPPPSMPVTDASSYMMGNDSTIPDANADLDLNYIPAGPIVLGEYTGGYVIFVPTKMPSSAGISAPAPQFINTGANPISQRPQWKPNMSASILGQARRSQPISMARSCPPNAAPVKQHFTFMDSQVPTNFVPNPENHARWTIDNAGRRHYLNAPKNKRQFMPTN
ncbi:hypothetical protein ASPZODRAFT_140277 [Penicilliopsis zonata CBS 506.65]|uniref:Uncharacterized protein n=1 Tax=Penicilliopsis zonata CBS 506.65 TaxID=1073090 RepID=A0A1L9SQK4_9EURO|nr:hypothetical protein ASPZODRAFT_140277 [Penicilliopsis zonata CBS 506.65]OJJ49373.1 hypothetical protein ASPZODRAFT_140277 [Penicilliopsis zonata CBS 506.65]